MLTMDNPKCSGCPLQGGQPFTPDTILPGSPVMVFSDTPGYEASIDKLLPLGGLSRDDISYGTALRCQRWSDVDPSIVKKKPGGQGQLKVIKQAIDHCQKAHFKPPAGTRLIVAQGGWALLALTGEESIAEWRGWLLPLKGEVHGLQHSKGQTLDVRDSSSSSSGIYHPTCSELPVLATLHPIAVLRQPEMGFVNRLDWGKVARYLAGKWPQPLPPIERKLPDPWPEVVAGDTEYIYKEGDKPHAGQVYRYSLATFDRRVWVIDTPHYPKCITLPSECRLILHNAVADYLFFRRLLRPWALIKIEDTMLGHSVLWSGMSREKEEHSRVGGGLGHGLDFLLSIYGSLNRHKHLSVDAPDIYAGADALGTMDLWQGLSREFKADPQSEYIYRECVLPLVPIIVEAEAKGLKVNKARVAEASQQLMAQTKEAQLRAQASVGWPILLSSSSQVSKQLYTIEGLKLKKGRG